MNTTQQLKEILTIENLKKLEEFNKSMITQIKKLLFEDKIEPFLIEMVLHKELYNLCSTAEKQEMDRKADEFDRKQKELIDKK